MTLAVISRWSSTPIELQFRTIDGLTIRFAESEERVQIIAGARDPAVPPVNAEFLHERLPNSKLDIVEAIDLGDLVTGGRMQHVGGPLPSHNLVRLPPST